MSNCSFGKAYVSFLNKDKESLRVEELCLDKFLLTSTNMKDKDILSTRQRKESLSLLDKIISSKQDLENLVK